MTPMPACDLQPTLSDEIVTLRPLREEDHDELYRCAADPKIWAHHPARERWQQPDFDAFFAEALAAASALVAVDPGSGALMGTSRFDTKRVEPGEIEIGWTFLARRWWGGRVNAAMKRLMVGHALLTCSRAVFWVGQDNIVSRRALEKIGALLMDRTLDVAVGGRPVRHVLYGIDRANFAGGPLNREIAL